jgi:hypothetical protein
MARTFILAWVIGLLGLIMIGGGIWGVIDLFRQEVRAPLKAYGGAISMICGGVACWAWRRRCVYCSVSVLFCCTPIELGQGLQLRRRVRASARRSNANLPLPRASAGRIGSDGA